MGVGLITKSTLSFTINHKLYQCIGCRNFVPDNQQVLLDIEEYQVNFTS